MPTLDLLPRHSTLPLPAPGTYTHAPTEWIDGISYAVHYRADNGDDVPLGHIAHYHHAPQQWYATFDDSDPARRTWWGPLDSRELATQFLHGAHAERRRPGVFDSFYEARFLRTRPNPPLEQSLPDSRVNELAFLRSAPTYLGGYRILRVGAWRPGTSRTYAYAVVSTLCAGEFGTAELLWVDDHTDGTDHWRLRDTHNGMTTLEHAMWDMEIRAHR